MDTKKAESASVPTTGTNAQRRMTMFEKIVLDEKVAKKRGFKVVQQERSSRVMVLWPVYGPKFAAASIHLIVIPTQPVGLTDVGSATHLHKSLLDLHKSLLEEMYEAGVVALKQLKPSLSADDASRIVAGYSSPPTRHDLHLHVLLPPLNPKQLLTRNPRWLPHADVISAINTSNSSTTSTTAPDAQ